METCELTGKWRIKVFYNLFVDLAIDRFVSAENAYIELNKQENELPDDTTYKLVAEIRKCCIETICFTAMALESFINTFAASNISESFAETIDRLDVPSKWILTMQVGKGIQLKKGEKPIQRIAKCVQLRNAFVHNKSKPLYCCKECGSLHIPNMDLLNDYILPANEALKAIEDSSNWIDNNWDKGTLNFEVEYMNKKIKDKYKTVDNTWTFIEPTVLFN